MGLRLLVLQRVRLLSFFAVFPWHVGVEVLASWCRVALFRARLKDQLVVASLVKSFGQGPCALSPPTRREIFFNS